MVVLLCVSGSASFRSVTQWTSFDTALVEVIPITSTRTVSSVKPIAEVNRVIFAAPFTLAFRGALGVDDVRNISAGGMTSVA
jgi:hypothetical protein